MDADNIFFSIYYRMRYRFDTIFIHCGSCVEHFIADNFSSLEVIRTIVIESDQDIENESSCDQQKTCRNLRFWIEKLENELRFKRGEIKREQSYIMQIIPGDILYHYVLIKK